MSKFLLIAVSLLLFSNQAYSSNYACQESLSMVIENDPDSFVPITSETLKAMDKETMSSVVQKMNELVNSDQAIKVFENTYDGDGTIYIVDSNDCEKILWEQ